MEEEHLGLSDSDNDYDDDGRAHLEELRNNFTVDKGNKNTVFDFDDDDDEDDDQNEGEDNSDLDMASDLDEKNEYLPDDRAWGQKRKSFYNTDFDKDYSGAYGAEDAEIAQMEEEEARKIQKRLMEQLSDADFHLTDAVDLATAESENKSVLIESDISSLSKRQQLELFQKESPEFNNLVEDFEDKMGEVRKRILPILNLIKDGKLKKTLASDFITTKYRIILNYCTNILFYILLKTKRIAVKNHPVMKSLYRYRQLLLQMQQVDEEIITPQVDKILQACEADSKTDKPSAPRKKKLLKILKKSAKKPSVQLSESVADDKEAAVANDELEMSASDDDEGIDEPEDASGEGDAKRAITYEMAKNKGLTPKRSKEQRNPRVKHRNKFRKSMIRRRGQVRTPRTEIPVYGGEPTGIKIGLKKGRKFL